jgi:hypothetical protein
MKASPYSEKTYTAFKGSHVLAQGSLAEASKAALEIHKKEPHASVLMFDDDSGQVVDLDRNLSPSREPSRGPGRPKLGVIAREVTLLPRHWDWLNEQPGGASVALRKLVEEARRNRAGMNRVRAAQESVYQFLGALAGNEPGFEEALRALYRGDQKRFDSLIKSWPGDIPAYARRLAAVAFERPAT